MIRIKEIAALGTLWWFDLFDAPAEREREVTDHITNRLTIFEKQYSRFLNTSFIGTLNRTGTLENPTDELVALLQFGKKLYKDTGGMFNFLSAHTQVARGYGTQQTVRSNDNTAPANPDIDLIIDRKQITLHRGAVDLGGFGKGWLIDEVANMLQTDLGIKHFLINGGGDIYATTLSDNAPVDIFVEHPIKQKHSIAKIPLANQGFAGSSTHKRRWHKSDKAHHHIITEHDNEMSAHVIAETALTADTFATIACATPPQAAPKLLQDNNLDYLLICNGVTACSDFFKQHLLTATEEETTS